MRSLFRPLRAPDPAILDDHKPLIRDLQRRGLLRGSLSLGALSLLTGCDVSDSTAVGQALRAVSTFNDRVQAALFDPNKLAPEYSAADVLKPPRFNAYYDIEHVRPVDGDTWRLELAGLVTDRTPWTRQSIAALPQREMIIRHICVEGWDYIGQWSGPTLRSLLEHAGADLRAQIRRVPDRRRLSEQHRHADRAASADVAGHAICGRDPARSVRLPVTAADLDEAGLQESEMDHVDRGDQHLRSRLLGEARFNWQSSL